MVERARSTFLGGGARDAVLVDLPAELPPVRADRYCCRRARIFGRFGTDTDQ